MKLICQHNTILKCYWMDQIVSTDKIHTKIGYCCTLAWQDILKINVTPLLNVSFFQLRVLKKPKASKQSFR